MDTAVYLTEAEHDGFIRPDLLFYDRFYQAPELYRVISGIWPEAIRPEEGQKPALIDVIRYVFLPGENHNVAVTNDVYHVKLLEDSRCFAKVIVLSGPGAPVFRLCMPSRHAIYVPVGAAYFVLCVM
jgi:hypothetical protein